MAGEKNQKQLEQVVESRNMSDDVLFTPELIVLMQPIIC